MQYPYSTKDKITYWVFGDRIPLTKLVIASNIATFFAIAFFRLDTIGSHMMFSSDTVVKMPWTLVSYAFVSVVSHTFVSVSSPIFIAFACYWLWAAGGSLERSWGTRRFASYFFAMVAISALGLLAGASTIVKSIPVGTAGLWLPIAGVTVAFAMVSPDERILFMFVLPLKLKYLALIDAAFVLVAYGLMNPFLGIFALAGCAYSYWYVMRPRVYKERASRRAKIVRVYESRGFFHGISPFRWLKEYREAKRLKKFFERSGLEDEDQEV